MATKDKFWGGDSIRKLQEELAGFEKRLAKLEKITPRERLLADAINRLATAVQLACTSQEMLDQIAAGVKKNTEAIVATETESENPKKGEMNP